MSLISLLIALAAERSLSASSWQFKTYYQYWSNWLLKKDLLTKCWQSQVGVLSFIFIPVLCVYGLLLVVDDGLLHLVLSTLVLIVCFGSVATRQTYKHYLQAAFRGELTTCQFYHSQLSQDKNLPKMAFGETLIWLNYRYYIAIMLFFVFFGAPGAVFYRLLTTLIEQPEWHNKADEGETLAEQESVVVQVEQNAYQSCQRLLFWLDCLPVRLVSFAYMLVGHFSNALTVWLENLFDINKAPHFILAEVAHKSEDKMIAVEDCTTQTCALVQLAKRTVLLVLAIVAILTLSGVLN